MRWYDGSGHYGRGNGGSTGAEEEAVIISKAIGKPVRLQWMRWDDMQWSTQHPAAFSDVTAGLDSNGNLVSFRANHYMAAMQDDRMVGALLAGLPTITAPSIVPYPGTFGSSVNGVSDPWVYDKVPNALQVAYGTTQLGTDPASPNFNTQIGMRGHSMRTPAQRQQNFAQESMMSELAAAAKIDQIQFRLNNTTDPRVINVLNIVKKESGWETRPSPNPSAKSSSGQLIGQGVSQMSREGAVWAAVAKVSVNPKTGKVSVTDITTAGDLGILVNPLQQKRMMEGGAVMGDERDAARAGHVQHRGDHEPRLGHLPDPPLHGAPEDQRDHGRDSERWRVRHGWGRPERICPRCDRERRLRRNRQAAAEAAACAQVHQEPARHLAGQTACSIWWGGAWVSAPPRLPAGR